MRRKPARFKHQKYSKGFLIEDNKLTSSYDQLFQARLPYFDELLFGNPLDQEIIKPLEKKFVGTWKRQLIQARNQMGRRKFNQAFTAWLSGDGIQMVGRKRRVAGRRDSPKRAPKKG